jgi:WASH complex subunit strumpellin
MSTQIREFEVKVSKEFLKDNVLRETRFALAKKTYEITVMTEGMLKLDKTLMGVLELDPKKVLIVGLRNELCRKLAEILHEEFIFKREVGQQTQILSNEAQIERNAKGKKV